MLSETTTANSQAEAADEQDWRTIASSLKTAASTASRAPRRIDGLIKKVKQ
jgi:outer membrane murein-binding lipoprotein Lpp